MNNFKPCLYFLLFAVLLYGCERPSFKEAPREELLPEENSTGLGNTDNIPELRIKFNSPAGWAKIDSNDIAAMKDDLRRTFGSDQRMIFEPHRLYFNEEIGAIFCVSKAALKGKEKSANLDSMIDDFERVTKIIAGTSRIERRILESKGVVFYNFIIKSMKGSYEKYLFNVKSNEIAQFDFYIPSEHYEREKEIIRSVAASISLY